ncbi:MAG: hypothetical protein ACI4RM_02490 [Ruminococcus sp.]
MAENLRYKRVTIRKPHICFGCGRKFDTPAKMVSAACTDCGTVNSYYLCMTCDDIVSEMQYGDEYGYGDLKNEALEREKNG